jgi:hypothetical protein
MLRYGLSVETVDTEVLVSLGVFLKKRAERRPLENGMYIMESQRIRGENK